VRDQAVELHRTKRLARRLRPAPRRQPHGVSESGPAGRAWQKTPSHKGAVTMPAHRLPLLLIVLAACALGLPAGASAAQSFSDTITGHEYYATSTDGRFAGSAAGSLSGDWHADVQHTPLCISCTATATISGGS